MLDLLRNFIAYHRLISPGDRVGAAVSGGADSVCLFRLLCELRNDIGFALSVVYFDHQLRPESANEAHFVAELAGAFDCPFHRDGADVRAYAALQRQSLETAARNLRYAWFDSLLNERMLSKIATAHTQTDQAETVVMKLLRGAGPRGLSGIHPIHHREQGSIIRPLLGVSRTEIEEHLRSIGQPWLSDLSNAELIHTRNRIRYRLMPLLREFNPEADSALAQTAEIMRAEEAWLQHETERALPFLLLPGEPVRGGGRSSSFSSSPHQQESFALSLEVLARHPLPLQRRLVREALRPLGGLSLKETDRVLDLAASSTRRNQWVVLSGGIRVRRLHRELRIESGEPAVVEPMGYETHASFDGTPLTLTAGPVSLRLSLVPFHGMKFSQPLSLTLPVALRLRNWRPGDRFQAAHTRAPKKVKERLQALKLTPEERAQWPVLELESQAQLLWMRGIPAPLIVMGNSILIIEDISSSAA